MEVITAYHPTGLTIDFEETAHTYTDVNGQRYESGTTFVGKSFDKFDMDKMSVACSEGDNPKYKGRTPKDIKAEWQAEGDRGRDEGTNIHAYAEGLVCEWNTEPEPLSERCWEIFKQVRLAVTDLYKYYEFIGAEVIIFSPELKKSGMIDLLMYSKKSNEIIILDWKQNKKITRENNFQKAKKPINHLQDTDIAHYSLQLSFYEHILKRENYFPGVAGFRRALIHLTETNFKIIDLEDYSFEINKMLKHEGL